MKLKAPLLVVVLLIAAILACGGTETPIAAPQGQTPTPTQKLKVQGSAPSPSSIPTFTPLITRRPTDTPLPQPGTLPPSPTPPPIIHEVQSGETLGGIAKQYGVSLEALAAVNDIADPSLIQVGQELIIPSSDAAVSQVEPTATEAVSLIIDSFAVIDSTVQEVGMLLGEPFLTAQMDAGLIDPLPDGGEVREYSVGRYTISVMYNKSELATGFQVTDGLVGEGYSLEDWSTLLPRFGVAPASEPDVVAELTRRWENYQGYVIEVIKDATSGEVWSVKIFKRPSVVSRATSTPIPPEIVKGLPDEDKALLIETALVSDGSVVVKDVKIGGEKGEVAILVVIETQGGSGSIADETTMKEATACFIYAYEGNQQLEVGAKYVLVQAQNYFGDDKWYGVAAIGDIGLLMDGEITTLEFVERIRIETP